MLLLTQIQYTKTIFKANVLRLFRKFFKMLKAQKNLSKNNERQLLFKNIFLNLLTSLSNKKLEEQICLAQFKKHKVNSDFHKVGHDV